MMMVFGTFNSQSLKLGLSLFGFYAIYTFFIYPLFLHPLRHIPRAHWSVSFPYIGSLWILCVRYSGRNNVTIYAAHRNHGDVVRLAYNELSINCIKDGVRTVYGGGWEKTDWYARRSVIYGVINMFLTTHRAPHSQKKRTLANIYSKSHLQLSTQLKANTTFLLVHRFWPMIQSFSETREAVDVHEMNKAFSMDVIAAYVFGISHSTNFTQDVSERRHVINGFRRRHAFIIFVTEMPPKLCRWLERLHLTAIPNIIADANLVLESWNSRMCDAADSYLSQTEDASQMNNPGNEPVVYRQFKTGIQKLRIKDPMAAREILPHIADPSQFMKSANGLKLMARNELHSEMFDHLDAGHRTSGIALTYLYWEMSHNPSMQERLHKEVLRLVPQMTWPAMTPAQDIALADPRDIDELPYLHAVIMETLRLHAPLPGQEPRISPHVDGGSTLGEFSGIPGGVKVSAMPYTLHRHEDAFPNPEHFDPERWLTSDEEELKEMHRWFWAFGSGGRMCVGSHFAIQSMKTQVVAIYSNWKTEIVDDNGIEKTDGYAAEPRAGKLMLRFVHR